MPPFVVFTRAVYQIIRSDSFPYQRTRDDYGQTTDSDYIQKTCVMVFMSLSVLDFMTSVIMFGRGIITGTCTEFSAHQ